MKRSGQRIYILENGLWRLLTMPSAFEMGLNSATWYYKLPKDTIRVRTFTSPDSRVIQLEVTSQKDAYMWAVSNHLLLGPKNSTNLSIRTNWQNASSDGKSFCYRKLLPRN